MSRSCRGCERIVSAFLSAIRVVAVITPLRMNRDSGVSLALTLLLQYLQLLRHESHLLSQDRSIALSDINSADVARRVVLTTTSCPAVRSPRSRFRNRRGALELHLFRRHLGGDERRQGIDGRILLEHRAKWDLDAKLVANHMADFEQEQRISAHLRERSR